MTPLFQRFIRALALVGASCLTQQAGAACLNVSLIPWPSNGWAAPDNLNGPQCITASATSTSDIGTSETGADSRFEADITLAGSGSQASQGGLVVRSSGSYANGYLVMLHRLSTGSEIAIYRNNVLKVTQSISALSWGTPYRLRVDSVGNVLNVYFNNGTTPVVTYTDSTPLTSGNFGLFRAGTAVSFNNIFKSALDVTVHTSELGYQRYAEKRGMLRASTEVSAIIPVAGAAWNVRNSGGGVVASGTVGAKTSKWGIDFYPVDFSSITTAGSYTLEVTLNGAVKGSRVFAIGDAPLIQSGMYTIAVQQLEDRFAGPTPPALAAAGLPFPGGYLPASGITRNDVVLSNNPGSGPVSAGTSADSSPPTPTIWIDCSSNYAEMGSVSITTRALTDLYRLQGTQFSTANKNAMLLNIKRGADYTVSLQESHPGDPLRDGRFRHSTLINLINDNGVSAWWAGNVHNWNNQGIGIVTLATAYQTLKNQTGYNGNTASYLAAAKKAWTLATSRRYYLNEDIDINQLPGYDYGDFLFWTRPNNQARGFYNIPDTTWNFTNLLQQTTGYQALRTRELSQFLWANTLLYQITDETGSAKEKYLIEAKAVAAEIASRQYLDHANKLDGTYGMLKEFSQVDGNTADANAFSVESGQTGWVHIGNYVYSSLDGFIDLLKLAPTDPDAAKWHRVLHSWAEGYQKPAAVANPFRIAPNTVYADPNNDSSNADASIYWFGNRMHGGNEIYGQAARALLTVGNYLNDESYQTLANANVQMYAGLNPGAVVGGQVKATSMIKGFPATSLAGGFVEPWAPTGSVGNGYNATPAFTHAWWQSVENSQVIPPDGPNSFGSGDESWIAHSHSYVMGAAALEGAHTVNLDFSQGTAAVGVTVQATFPSNSNFATRSYTVPSTGKLSITDLPLGQKVVLGAQRSGFPNFVTPINTVGGGSSNWTVDWNNYIGAGLGSLPATLAKNTTYTFSWTAVNYGSAATTATVSLSSVGGALSATSGSASLASGASNTTGLTFTTGSQTEPYVIRAVFTSGKNVKTINLSGLVQ